LAAPFFSYSFRSFASCCNRCEASRVHLDRGRCVLHRRLLAARHLGAPRRGGGITNATTVASVNGRDIPYQTYYAATQNLAQQEEQQRGRALSLDERRQATRSPSSSS
jgi:hypothetical protein